MEGSELGEDAVSEQQLALGTCPGWDARSERNLAPLPPRGGISAERCAERDALFAGEESGEERDSTGMSLLLLIRIVVFPAIPRTGCMLHGVEAYGLLCPAWDVLELNNVALVAGSNKGRASL